MLKTTVLQQQPWLAFSSALLFLIFIATSLHWLSGHEPLALWWLLPLLWGWIILLSVLEFVEGGLYSLPATRLLVLAVILPPFRLATHPFRPGWLWLPKMGWRQHGRDLEKDLEHWFDIPMLIISAFMIPIIAVEMLWPTVATLPTVQLALQIATGAIWLAFTVEFIVRVSAAGNRLRYCAQHWLDLFIILLPLISFLRSARLLRLGKLAKTIRAYRLRGLTSRALRALVAIDLIGRLLRRTPESRLAHLREQLALHQEEIDLLETKIAELEQKVQQSK